MPTDISSRFSEALLLLLQAYEYAQELQRPPRDFALEFEALRETGLNHNDCRWLVYQNVVQHAVDVEAPCDTDGSISTAPRVVLTSASCFLLTSHGLALAHAVLDRRNPSPGPDVLPARELSPPSLAQAPRWDRDCRELWLGDALIKQFKVPAANQEIILQAFQEEGWPPCIDDPLPPQFSINPKRRLHDTLGALNRNQKHRFLRFRGNGAGNFCWESVPPTAHAPSASELAFHQIDSSLTAEPGTRFC
jgi:hypothetical protein